MYQDSSLLLDFFTRHYGKIRLVGRGARNNKTSLQMFQCLSISFKGRGDLKSLSQWEIADQPRRLLGDDLILAMYANELILRLLPENDEYSQTFSSYWTFLSSLNDLDSNEKEFALRNFENQMLEDLGYGLDFGFDINSDLIKGKAEGRGISIPIPQMDSLNTNDAILEYMEHKMFKQGTYRFLFKTPIENNYLQELIKQAIKNKYGWDIPVIILTPNKLDKLVKSSPFTNEQLEKSYFCFYQSKPKSENVTSLNKQQFIDEHFVATSTCVYIVYEKGAGRAKLTTNKMESTLNVSITARNYKTVSKLITLSKTL